MLVAGGDGYSQVILCNMDRALGQVVPTDKALYRGYMWTKQATLYTGE